MEYVKVESSQIEAIGFGDGFYGPETLGIQFPPTKKQAAAGQTGSIYHYANVSPRTHQALMAAPSIGSYFGQNIKAHPEQYPYTKVEADPQQPSVGAASNIRAVQEDTNGDQPAPGTSIAVIDTLENSALFASGGVTDAQLAAGREWYLANAPKGIETEEKRTALKRFARPLQKLRTGIEARAKEFTGETKRKLAAIDTEKRRLVLLVGGIEDEVLRPLTEWEQEEESRKVRLSGIANELAAKGQRVYMDMAEIEKAIAELESFDVSTMQECKVERRAPLPHPSGCSSRNWIGDGKPMPTPANWPNCGASRPSATRPTGRLRSSARSNPGLTLRYRRNSMPRWSQRRRQPGRK